MTGYADPDPDISFTVFGEPGVTGNKSPGIWRSKDGRSGVTMREGRTKGAQERAKLWRERVTEVVQALAAEGCPMLDGPIVASIVFLLPKPKSAPKRRRTWPDRKPDVSKMLRAIEDPMTGVVIADDARIVRFLRLEKDYAVDATPDDPRPRAEVRLWEIERFLVPEA